ncbi:VIR protein [Plasmodium vivax]|uniref:VIR protein n=1 Tax=Plasmodium vivax TaxID=5855 RepID=A0A1G4E8H1_PLAVI|nr:VIR protein [Plasmodium vivax]
MTSNQEDLWYVQYNQYNYVKHEYKRAIEYDYEEKHLNNIMPKMRSQMRNVNENDAIIKNFYKALSNGNVLYSGLNKNYCKYINFKLNEKYSNNNYQSKIPDFKAFKKFVYELNHEKHGNQNNSCENYINYLDAKILNNITFLHRLYDAYNEIKSTPIAKPDETCEKIVALDRSYRDTIDDHYDNDKHLYEKLDTIKGLILGKIGNLKTDCVNNIYFSPPRKVIELQAVQARKKAEEAEAKKAKEEEARQAMEEAAIHAKEKASKRLQEEQYREQQKLLHSKNLLSQSSDKVLQVMHHENGELLSTGYRSGSQELGASTLQSHTQSFESSEMSESPRGLSWKEDYTQRGPIPYTIEGTEYENEVIKEQGDKDTTKSGKFFGSSGIPGYITEVFGSVDPVPVVGVSGGMGALFLLFRYTPLGTFFRGGRGRAHRIPRSFNGQFLGAFPDINEYDGRYIGYGPMNIPYGAE